MCMCDLWHPFYVIHTQVLRVGCMADYAGEDLVVSSCVGGFCLCDSVGWEGVISIHGDVLNGKGWCLSPGVVTICGMCWTGGVGALCGGRAV